MKPFLVKGFHKSTELINLTVTVYTAMLGLGIGIDLFQFFSASGHQISLNKIKHPCFTISDHLERRLIFVSCLLILSLSCVGLVLVPVSDYWVLVLFRCIQAIRSASIVSIGAGVIGDMWEPQERGGSCGGYDLESVVSPSIGPTGSLGWR